MFLLRKFYNPQGIIWKYKFHYRLQNSARIEQFKQIFDDKNHNFYDIVFQKTVWDRLHMKKVILMQLFLF